jgi:hypothetical protein
MRLIKNSLLLQLALILLFKITLFSPTSINAAPAVDLNLLHSYMRETLRIEDVSMYDLSLRMEPLRPYAERYFSPSDAGKLRDIFKAFSRTESANAVLIGAPGIGKSFTHNQIISLFSYGIIPDFLKSSIGYGNPNFKMMLDAYIGKTQIIKINHGLLSNNPNKSGAPFDGQEIKMEKVLQGLFDAATREFHRKNEKGTRIGKRTIFIMEEIGNYDKQVLNSLLQPLEKSGFKNPNDPFLALQDTGYNVIGMTTVKKFDHMIGELPDLLRRVEKIKIVEKPDSEILKILHQKVEELAATHGGLMVDPEVFDYILAMRSFLYAPPVAMPDAGLRTLEGIYASLIDKPYSESKNSINLQEAQEYIFKHTGLTDVWFPGPNGEPPLYDLARRVKLKVVGHEEIIEKIATIYGSWFNMDFGGELPIIMLIGPPGNGKDTIYEAFMEVLHGNIGKALMASIDGVGGFEMESLFKGPPRGNHSDSSPPELLEKLNGANGTGSIFLNEAKGTPKRESEKLKTIFENPWFLPKGIHSEPYPILLPIWIAGQHGEELFYNLDADAARSKYERLTQENIEQVVLHTDNEHGVGEFSYALLQRILRAGGLFLVPPIHPDQFESVAKIQTKKITERVKPKLNMDISTTSALDKAIAQYAVETNSGPRRIASITRKFTVTAVHLATQFVGSQPGLPRSNVRVQVDATPDGKTIIVRQLDAQNKFVKEWQFSATALSLEKQSKSCAELI